MEIRRAFGDPRHEAFDPGMGTQGLDRIVASGKLRLGKGRVNLVMADLMQQDRRPALAAAQAGDQVMQALLGAGRNGPVAERADGGVVHGG